MRNIRYFNLNVEHFTVSKEPQCARFRRILTCSSINLIHITQCIVPGIVSSVYMHWRNRVKCIVVYSWDPTVLNQVEMRRIFALLGSWDTVCLYIENIMLFSWISVHDLNLKCIKLRKFAVYRCFRENFENFLLVRLRGEIKSTHNETSV